jgi:hypothetical protein
MPVQTVYALSEGGQELLMSLAPLIRWGQKSAPDERASSERNRSGESPHAECLEHPMGGAQLFPGLFPPALPPEPFAVDEMGSGEVIDAVAVLLGEC